MRGRRGSRHGIFLTDDGTRLTDRDDTLQEQHDDIHSSYILYADSGFKKTIYDSYGHVMVRRNPDGECDYEYQKGNESSYGSLCVGYHANDAGLSMSETIDYDNGTGRISNHSVCIGTTRFEVSLNYADCSLTIRTDDKDDPERTIRYGKDSRLDAYSDGVSITWRCTYDSYGRGRSVGSSGTRPDGSMMPAAIQEDIGYEGGPGSLPTEHVSTAFTSTRTTLSRRQSFSYESGTGRILHVRQEDTDSSGDVDVTDVDYEYDHLGRLKRDGDAQYVYEYARMSEMTSKTRGHISLGYDTKGRLSTMTGDYNARLEYDVLGNLVSLTGPDHRLSMTYSRGHLLRTFRDDAEGITYSLYYTPDDILARISSEKYGSTDFLYEGNALIGMNLPDHVMLRFSYTQAGRPGAMRFFDGRDWHDLQYVLDALGDVIAIIDDEGDVICQYVYDSWGNLLASDFNPDNKKGGEFARRVMELNPIRYRGYLYVREIGMYYLISRFYHPTIMSFITPDDYTYIDPDEPEGNHVYCYCGYDPVNLIDPSGNSVSVALMIVSALIGAAVSGAFAAMNEVRQNDWDIEKWDWKKISLSSVIGGVSGALSALTGGMKFSNEVVKCLISCALGGISNFALDYFDGDINNILDGSMSLIKGVLSGLIMFGIGKIMNYVAKSVVTYLTLQNSSLTSRMLSSALTVNLSFKGNISKRFFAGMLDAFNEEFDETALGTMISDIISELLGEIM
jgi:RHS repeat-associated protein